MKDENLSGKNSRNSLSGCDFFAKVALAEQSDIFLAHKINVH